MAPTRSSEKEAWRVLSDLKTKVIHILWNDIYHRYNNDHLLIPWMQEEAEYAIRKMDLPGERKEFFIQKIGHVIGEYSEEM